MIFKTVIISKNAELKSLRKYLSVSKMIGIAIINIM